jgi:osmotically inducible lipoprotein OsmB
MKTMIAAAAVAATLLSLGGCATDRQTAYTVGGAAVGGVVGSAIGGTPGAVAGAVGGAVLGNEASKR